MNRQLFGLTGAIAMSVMVAWPASTAYSTVRMNAKQAALKGMTTAGVAAPEQMVSRLIVKLRNPTASELAQPMSALRIQTLSATAGVSLKSVRAMAGGASLLALDAPRSVTEAKAIAARLQGNSDVLYAEPDIMLKRLTTPNDTRFFDWQWNLFSPSSVYTGALTAGGTKSAVATGGANLPLAWDVTVGSSNVVIAIVDTGIVNHQDLNGSPAGDTYIPAGRFLAGYDFISETVGTLPANFVSNDGDGRDADASDPGDWVTVAEEQAYPTQCDDGNTGPQNSSWHGSHMAGVAAAMTNNAMGIAGIGWNVRVLPVRALGKCGGSLSDIAEAIRWAAGLPVPGVPANPTPAQVINLSLGSGPTTACDGTMQSAVDAVIAAGAVVVAATGNDGTIGISSPAKCTGVIAVTAHTINGENADYANIGAAGGAAPQPTISSPGGGSPVFLGNGLPATDDPNWFGYYVWSTILFGNTGPSSVDGSTPPRSGPAYSGFTGTSAATPQVAAVAALIKSMIPGASPTAIRNFIVSNVRPHPAGGACATGGGFAGQCGPGLLDANAAVRAAALVAPPIVLAQPQSVSVVEGQAATFTVNVVGAEPFRFQWLRNGTPIAGANSASYTTSVLTVAADNGAVYSVVITNAAGSATSASATVGVAPQPSSPAPPTGGGGGGGGALPLWQLLLLTALSLAGRVRLGNRQQ